LADVANISDPKVKESARLLDAGLIGMMAFASDHSNDGQAQMGESTTEAEQGYSDLIARCGQLIQGRQ
jgi:hypothetical protein